MSVTESFVEFPAQNFFDLLLPDLPGASNAIVRQELDRVMRDYFRRSGAWHIRYEPASPLLAGVNQVDLNEELRLESRAYRIAQVYAVWEDDQYIIPQSFTRVTTRRPLANPRMWRSLAYGVVEFSGPDWTEDKTNLSYQVTLYPVERSVSYPQWIWDDHSEAIRNGVLGRMQTQIKKPYSNPVEGRTHMAQYNSDVNRVRAMVDRGNTPNGLSWAYPRSFR